MRSGEPVGRPAATAAARTMKWRCALSLAFALSGCDAEGRIQLVVDTDLQPGTEVDAIDIAASSATTFTAMSHSVIASEASLPVSVLLVMRGDETTPVFVRVVAVSPEHLTLVRREAQLVVPRGRTARLDIRLTRSCAADDSCTEGERTCVEGACVDPFVDSSALPDGDPDAEPMRLIDGPSPADAGGMDAGGACAEGAACEASAGCQRGVTQCIDGVATCSVIDTMPAGTECGDGRRCDAEGQCGF
ncbi:MAG: hypothetical protein AB7S26_05530 [Sandaracinaceae bacterium]